MMTDALGGPMSRPHQLTAIIDQAQYILDLETQVQGQAEERASRPESFEERLSGLRERLDELAQDTQSRALYSDLLDLLVNVNALKRYATSAIDGLKDDIAERLFNIEAGQRAEQRLATSAEWEALKQAASLDQDTPDKEGA